MEVLQIKSIMETLLKEYKKKVRGEGRSAGEGELTRVVRCRRSTLGSGSGRTTVR